ncbi:UNVERIFIED_CONTAM: hypothetical protein Slati_3901100 [Sesamum latifolium]|uniref:Uncharacterized protein n=1 Tax=Sesamum latifolium TaxID=2727402 RepID=A0AAW2TM96_9LAMI
MTPSEAHPRLPYRSRVAVARAGPQSETLRTSRALSRRRVRERTGCGELRRILVKVGT